VLQNGKVILFIFFIYPILAFAGVDKPILGKSEGCLVRKLKFDKSFKTILTCDQLNYEKEQDFLNSKFVKWATIKTKEDTLVILFFTKGVHGEKAEVFSLNKKLKIKTITSSWPIEIDQKKLEYKLDSNQKGEYPSYFLEFKDL
jgi:hypothetical protein